MDQFSGLKSKKTFGDQLEMDLFVEDELQRLQRQYRIMESDRTAYLENVYRSMGHQKAVIMTLKKEHASLKNDLAVADSTGNRRRDVQGILRMKAILADHTIFETNIKEEKRHLEDMDYQIRKIERQIRELKRKSKATETLEHERLRNGQTNVVKLENKLEVCVKKFCIVLTRNKELRKQIDHLLIERTIFNKTWENLLNKLTAGKKFMLDLIEQATLAYDQREEWCQKLVALKQRVHVDINLHTEEMRELQRTLNRDVELQQFLEVKGQRRIPRDMLKKEVLRREQLKLEQKEQFENYTKILLQIQEFAGEENIDRLAARFIKQEEENFALFNYVNELNTELETLSDSIHHFRDEIDAQNELAEERASKQKFTLIALKEQAIKHKAEADAEYLKCTNYNKTLIALFRGVAGLFNKIKCTNAPILDLLGQTSTAITSNVTTIAAVGPTNSKVPCDCLDTPNVLIGSAYMNIYNVVLYLGILDTKISDMMRNAYYLQITTKSKNKQFAPFNFRIPPLAIKDIKTPCPICVENCLVAGTINDFIQLVQTTDTVRQLLDSGDISIDGPSMHTVSMCNLPESRKIMKHRYNNE